MSNKIFIKPNCIKIYTCKECIYWRNSMDGVYCELQEQFYGAYEGMIYPEGRDGIHPKCPFLVGVNKKEIWCNNE